MKSAPLVLVLWVYTSVMNVFGFGNSVHGPEMLLLFIITRDGAVCGGMKRAYVVLGVETKKCNILMSSPGNILVILSNHMDKSHSKVTVAALSPKDFRQYHVPSSVKEGNFLYGVRDATQTFFPETSVSSSFSIAL